MIGLFLKRFTETGIPVVVPGRQQQHVSPFVIRNTGFKNRIYRNRGYEINFTVLLLMRATIR
jgi:hypothetical protein